MSAGAPRRLLSAFLGALAGLAVLVVAPPAASAEDPVADRADGPVDVEILSISPQVLEPGDDLKVTVLLTNTAGKAVSDAEAVLRINRFRMGSRAEVAAWAETGTTDDRTVAKALKGALKPGTPQTVELTVPADAVQLTDLPGLWGPRGMVIEVQTPRRSVGLARSYVLWNPDEQVPRVPVAAVLPVTGPATVVVPPATSDPTPEPTAEPTDSPGDGPTSGDATDPATGPTADPTSDPAPTGTDGTASGAGTASAVQAGSGDQAGPSLAELTAPGGTLDLMLRATTADSGVSLAVDPALVAQADAGGADTQQWAQRLRTAAASHDTFALPWADPDVAAVAHAAQLGLLDVAMEHSVAAADWATAGTLLWTPDGAPADGVTLGGVTASGAAAMVTAAQVADPDGQPEKTSSDSVRELLTGSGMVTALAPDAVLTELALADDASTPAAAAQRALAELALVARESVLPTAVVIAPDRSEAPDRTTLAAMMQAFRGAP
jgi:hypothetical protein